MSRLRQFILLALVVAVITLPAATQAAPADADLVLEAINVLDKEYVDQGQIDRVRLLNAAVAGVKEVLSAAGVTSRFAPIAPGTARAETERVFRAVFEAALAAGQGKVVARDVAYAAIRALAFSLNDSHTGFLTPEQYRERIARQQQQAGFTGVGMVVMARDQRHYVWAAIPRSPAAQQGVRQFDRIVRVNDVPTGGLTSEQVVALIRGPAGTVVTVSFERAGRPGPFALTLRRAPIVVPALFAARMVEPGIGYVYLYEFSEGSARDLRRALPDLLGRGTRALVLDLRSNVGGFLHELHAVVNLVLPKGVPVYQSMTSRGVQVVRTDRAPILPSSIPIVLLVNEGTASAAELLTAAIVEQRRGVAVGLKTAGAVEASTLMELSDGSALSVTIRRLSSGQGKRLEGAGLTPDAVIDLSAEDFLRGRDAQLARALQAARQRLAPAAAPVSPAPGTR